MAQNSESNLLESHVEKIILGLCLVVLLVVAAYWVVSSPRTVEVMDPASLFQTTTVPPPEADEMLLQGANRIALRNREANVSPMVELDWQEQFARASGRPFPTIASLDGGMTNLPIIRPRPVDSNALPSLPELLAMVPPPDKPVLWSGYEVRKLVEGNDIKFLDEVVCHGAAVYPYADLKRRLEEKLRRLPIPNPIVLARVEVHVQTRTPGGRYDGNEGAPAHLLRLPPTDSQGKVLPVPVIPDFDGKNLAAIRASIEELAAPNWQMDRLTPPYYDVFDPKSGGWVPWTIHLPDNPVSKLGPAAPRLTEPTPIPQPERRPPPPSEFYDRDRQTAPPPDGWRPTAPPPDGWRPTAPPPDGGRPTAPPPDGWRPTAPPPDGRYVPPPMPPTPAQPPTYVGPPREELPAPLGVPIKVIPALAVQQQAGTLLIAFHDNTLKVGQFYRYKIRVVIVNPLLGQDAVQDKQRDSYPREIIGPWSEWSDECVVLNPTQFFLTGQSPGKLRVTIFTQTMGQTVMKVFDIEPGTAIGGPATVDVAVPGVLGRIPTPVDFSTTCVAVEFNMNRQYWKRRPVGDPYRVTTTSLLYMDEKSRLRQRIQVEDMESPAYKGLLREAAGG